MGCYNVKCCVSNLPITEHDEVVACKLTKVNNRYIISGFPIHGRYDDYGGIMDGGIGISLDGMFATHKVFFDEMMEMNNNICQEFIDRIEKLKADINGLLLHHGSRDYSYMVKVSIITLLGYFIDTYRIMEVEFYKTIVTSGDMKAVDRIIEEIVPIYRYSTYIGFDIEPTTQRGQNINKKELIEFSRIYLNVLTRMTDFS